MVKGAAEKPSSENFGRAQREVRDGKAGQTVEPEAQFPENPDRASEAGYTYGEAAPEPPGRRMETPPAAARRAPVSDTDLKRYASEKKQRWIERRKRELETDLQEKVEQIGRRGNFRS